MNQDLKSLLEELIAALSSIGLASEADAISRFGEQLESTSRNERRAAARHIIDRCHVRWYGDFNLPVERPGDYPVYVFLDEVRRAVEAAAIEL